MARFRRDFDHVTSDLHLGHGNILIYEPEARPFADVEAMDAHILGRWQMVVGDDDHVLVVGDVAWSRDALMKMRGLPGFKTLLLGNHDGRYKDADLREVFDQIVGPLVLHHESVVVTHLPVHPACLTHGLVLNVHGHLHSHEITGPGRMPGPDPRYLNASVERWDLAPFPWAEIDHRLGWIRANP